MPVRGSADESWSALGVPWREAPEMAWGSFRDGGIGVGAVLTSGTGGIIGRGRDQRFASAAPRDLLATPTWRRWPRFPHGRTASATLLCTRPCTRARCARELRWWPG